MISVDTYFYKNGDIQIAVRDDKAVIYSWIGPLDPRDRCISAVYEIDGLTGYALPKNWFM